MSCRAQNYNSDIEYEKQMLNSYHSLPWIENDMTRSQFDLDMQKLFNERENEKPFNMFDNVLNTKSMEKYEPEYGFRTQFDEDMKNNFNNDRSNFNEKNAFSNVLEKYTGIKHNNFNRHTNHYK